MSTLELKGSIYDSIAKINDPSLLLQLYEKMISLKLRIKIFFSSQNFLISAENPRKILP